MKSKVAKVAVTGGIALATVGVGAGVASAQPAPNQPNWGQNSWQQQQQWNQPGRNNQLPPPVQQQQHNGFWFFGQWIQLPF